MKVKAEYDCWKCPEWHKTTFSLQAVTYCTQRVTIGKLTITIPQMQWLDKFWWQQTYCDWRFRFLNSQCTECRRWYPKKKMWKVSKTENWCQECM